MDKDADQVPTQETDISSGPIVDVLEAPGEAITDVVLAGLGAYVIESSDDESSS